MTQTPLSKNDTGASPIISLLLLTFLTLMMSITVYVVAISFHLPNAPSMSVIIARPNTETITDIPNMKITHKGGDTLDAGSWSISIVSESNSPNFRKTNTNFAVGDMIFSEITTSGNGNYSILNGKLIGDGVVETLRVGATYNVQIRDNLNQNIIMDNTVTMR